MLNEEENNDGDTQATGGEGGLREKEERFGCNSGEGHVGRTAPEPLMSTAKTWKCPEGCFSSRASPHRQGTHDQGVLPGLTSPAAECHLGFYSPKLTVPESGSCVGLKVVRTGRLHEARTEGHRLTSVLEGWTQEPRKVREGCEKTSEENL